MPLLAAAAHLHITRLLSFVGNHDRRQLGREVIDRADIELGPLLRRALLLKLVAKAEVGQLDAADLHRVPRGAAEHIRGLHVAVSDRVA